VTCIIAGDSAAEFELVQLFKGRIKHIILRITNNASLVDDFSQDTFLTVIKKIRNGDLEDAEKLGAFVAGVARNHAIEQMRTLRRRATNDLEAAGQVPDPTPDPFEQLLATEYSSDLRTMINLLNPRYKELLLRYYINEEPKETICAELALTSAQFDNVVHRARNSLKRNNLAEKGGRS
jgi:RNA polymerase sigma factor (sigma-70 family)